MTAHANEILMDHLLHPRHFGVVRGANGLGDARFGLCGDIVEISLLARDGRIVQAAFRAKGCGTAMACASWLVERIEGCTVDQAGELQAADILRPLGLPFAQAHAAWLALQALQLALASLPSSTLPHVRATAATSASVTSLLDPSAPVFSITHDYNPDVLRRFLENLQEVRAVNNSHHSSTDDTLARSRTRETLLCMLWDVERAFRVLPDKLKEAVYWRYDESLPEREAAERLGICQRALQKRIQRAEKLILRFLGGRDVAALPESHCKEMEGPR